MNAARRRIPERAGGSVSDAVRPAAAIPAGAGVAGALAAMGAERSRALRLFP